MLSFSAEFPLASTEPSDVVDCVAVWLKGSPHRVLPTSAIDALAAGKQSKIESGNQAVELISTGVGDDLAFGAKHTSVDQGIVYSTTIVSRVVESETWVNVRTDRAALDPQMSLKEARKPQIIRVLLSSIGGGLDGELWVRDTPFELKDSDRNMAIRLLNGDSENHLPVVYISRTFRDELGCDPSALARQLGGLAHVVVEPSRDFSRSIQPFTNSRNAYGGALGVYLPSGQRSLILESGQDEWYLRQLAAETVREALLTRQPMKGFAWADLEAARSRENITALKESGSTDLDAFVHEFDTENQALRDQNENLRLEVSTLKIEVQNLSALSSVGSSGVEKMVALQNYFPGETEQFLKEALEKVVNQLVEGSRRQAVITEYIERIEGTDEIDNRKKKLKELLSQAEKLDAKTEKELQSLGFSVTSDGKHHKLTYFGDQKLIFTMAKTASDWRAGKNLVADITRKVF